MPLLYLRQPSYLLLYDQPYKYLYKTMGEGLSSHSSSASVVQEEGQVAFTISISFTTYISHVQFRVICLRSAVICQPFVLIVAEKNLPQRGEGRFFPSQRQRKARHDRHDQTSNVRIRTADDESN
jgi:hypothetical protein